jgi:hypothetical protein
MQKRLISFQALFDRLGQETGRPLTVNQGLQDAVSILMAKGGGQFPAGMNG